MFVFDICKFIVGELETFVTAWLGVECKICIYMCMYVGLPI